MERHYTPSENMVYAEVDGTIGWMGGSIAPLRPNWSGLLPVPGNGDYEWQGFLDTGLLPRVFNPPCNKSSRVFRKVSSPRKRWLTAC
jgi:penicillin G amidase